MKKTLFMLFCLLCSIGAMAQKETDHHSTQEPG